MFVQIVKGKTPHVVPTRGDAGALPFCLPSPSLFLGLPAVLVRFLGWQVEIKPNNQPALVKCGNVVAQVTRLGGE